MKLYSLSSATGDKPFHFGNPGSVWFGPFQSRYCFRALSIMLLQAFLMPFVALATPPLPSDFNADGKEDLALWNSSTGFFTLVYANGSARSLQCGLPGDTPSSGSVFPRQASRVIVWRPSAQPTPSSFFICSLDSPPVQTYLGSIGDIPLTSSDFDGDSVSDIAVWRPGTGQWFISLSGKKGELQTFQLGRAGDIPVPADYDGDGLAQPAVFERSTGTWRVLSAEGKRWSRQWGLPGDIPLPGDFDGDGKADLALWRALTAEWLIEPNSTTPRPYSVKFGVSSDIPSVLDINGDGKSDWVLYRPSTGQIFYKTSLRSKLRALVVNAQRSMSVNMFPLDETFNDFDGDRLTDYAITRLEGQDLVWYVAFTAGQPSIPVQWGLNSDLQVPADFTGDGRTDIAVVRNVNGLANWYIRPSEGGDARTLSYGLAGDKLLALNFDFDTKSDFAAVRSLNNIELTWILLSSFTGEVSVLNWGLVGDQVLSGDFDGDRADELTVVRSINGLLYWFSRKIDGLQMPGVQWGLPGDHVRALDIDGDGKDDYVAVRSINGMLYIFVRLATGVELPPVQWGLSGDEFVPGRYRGGPSLQLAVWRPNQNAAYYVNNYPSSTFALAWGLAKDSVVHYRPVVTLAGLPPTPVTPPQNDAPTGFKCDVNLSPTDGGGGFVHKPISESDGKLVVVLPTRYVGVTRLDLIENNKVSESPRFVGNLNGNRPHFRASKPGSRYTSNLLERWTTADGRSYCVTVPNPGQRYD